MTGHAGFWRRVLAYLIDTIPIVIVVGAIFYFFCGFDEVIKSRYAQPDDIESLEEFLKIRNAIRDISFAIWVVYSMVLDCSPLQATFGKLAIGLKVVDKDGAQLSFFRSFARNILKFSSFIVLGLGFIWIAFSKDKQGWHDLIAKTYVIKK